MRLLRIIFVWGVCGVVAACATGKTPPAPTAMVPVEGSITTFIFGTTDFCNGSTELSEEDYCASQSTTKITQNISSGSPPSVPTVEVSIDAFEMDAHEVTNLQYLHCVELGDCTEPKFGNAGNITKYYNRSDGKYDNYPVVNVTWEQARTYCLSKGKRLPTEYEWELVATNGGTQAAPWGDSLDDCNNKAVAIKGCNDDHVTAPVFGPRQIQDSSDDVVEFGGYSIYDLGGNVSEWVEDKIDPFQTCKNEIETACTSEDGNCYSICQESTSVDVCNGYDAEDVPLEQPVSKAGSAPRGFRGGSYAHQKETVTKSNQAPLCSARPQDRSQSLAQDETKTFLGFRCARSLNP